MAGAVGRRRRQPKGRELIRGATKGVYEPQGSSLSGFAVVLAIALGGVIFAIAPRSLGLAPASIASDLLLSFAISLWFFGLVGLLIEVGELKALLVINQAGWRNFSITAILAAPIVAIYLGLRIFELPTLLETIFTGIALVLCFPVALGIAASLDEFYIKPRLGRIRSRAAKRRREQGSEQDRSDEILGSIVAVATWLLATVANLIAILDQLLS